MTQGEKKWKRNNPKKKHKTKPKRKKEDGEKRESFRFVSYSHLANRGESNVQIGAAGTNDSLQHTHPFFEKLSLSDDPRMTIDGPSSN